MLADNYQDHKEELSHGRAVGDTHEQSDSQANERANCQANKVANAISHR